MKKIKKNTNKNISLKRNFIFNSILTASNIVFPIISFPYISRVLGPDGTGRVSFATSVVFYFNIFAQLGVPTYGIRAVAKIRDDRKALANLVKEILLINIVLSIFAYFALFVSLLIVDKFKQERYLILIISCSVFLNTIGVEWLYKGLEQYEYIAKRSIVCKMISFIAMFLFVKAKNDYIVYGCITIFASSASNILNFVNLRKYIDPYRNHKLSFKRHFKAIAVFFAMAIATTIYTNLDIIMLGIIKNSLEVGYYDAAIKIRKLLLSFVTALGAVILPRASYYVDHGLLREFYDISKKALEFVIMLSSAVFCYFILYANECINFLSGKAYLNAVTPMQVVMPTVLFAGITNILGIQMLVPLGKEKIVLYSEVAGALVNIAVNTILIPMMASLGAAIGTFFAELVVLIIQISYLRRYYGISLISSLWIKIFIALTPSLILSGLVKLINLDSTFLKLVMSSAIFYTVYFINLLFLKEKLLVEILINCKEKYNIGRKKNEKS